MGMMSQSAEPVSTQSSPSACSLRFDSRLWSWQTSALPYALRNFISKLLAPKAIRG